METQTVSLPRRGAVIGRWDAGLAELVAVAADGGPYMLPDDALPFGRPPFDVRGSGARGVRLNEPCALRFAALVNSVAARLARGRVARFDAPTTGVPL